MLHRAIKNAVPIMADDAIALADDFINGRLIPRLHGLNIPSNTFDLVGSICSATGFINDIDILVDSRYVDPATVTKIIKRMSPEVRPLNGLQITSLAWPFHDKLHQIDLIFHDNHEYARWIRSSESSRFKGVHRNMLLMAIAAGLPVEVLEEAPDKMGRMLPILTRKYSLYLHDGLILRTQASKGKKGQPIVAKTTISKEMISKNPQEIITFLLGSFDLTAANNAESVIEAIRGPHFRYPELQDKILKDAAQRMIDDGLEMPESLERYPVVSLKRAFIK